MESSPELKPNSCDALSGRHIRLNTKFEKHIIHKSGEIKFLRTFFCFKMTIIVIPFVITPSNPHRTAPTPPIIKLIVNVLS